MNKALKNICFSQERNKSVEATEKLAFFTQLYVFFTCTPICVFGLHFLHILFFSSSCAAIRTAYHSWTTSLYYIVHMYLKYSCVCLLSFFVVDFLCRFNLLNYEFCVKAFLKRLTIYFPQPSDVVVIIPHKLSGLPFPRSEVLDRP